MLVGVRDQARYSRVTRRTDSDERRGEAAKRAGSPPARPCFDFRAACNTTALGMMAVALRSATKAAHRVRTGARLTRMRTTSRALGAGDGAAAQRLLAPPAFPNGPRTLQRLSSLPPLPAANRATSRAAAEVDRVDRIGGEGGGDGGGGHG